jgi:hypothetical protein
MATVTAVRRAKRLPRYTVTSVVAVERHRVLFAATTARGKAVTFHLRRDADVDGLVRDVRAGRRTVVQTTLPVRGSS